MKLWPRTMAGQLIGLILIGLVAAHLIGLLIFQTNRDAIHSISREQMIEHAAVAYRLGKLEINEARAALAAAGDGETRYSIDADSIVPANTNEGHDEQVITRGLNSRLGLAPDAIRIAILKRDVSKGELRIAMRLPDGLWINTVQQPVMAVMSWIRPLRFSAPVSTVPVMLIVFLFVRRILRPIKALAGAAERVSRGEQVDPLPVTGPEEAREVTQAFNLMQERLRRFVDDRTRMLGAISHDLRTPITSLRLRAELVDDPQLKTAMIRTIEEMRVMVEETLRFAKDDARSEATKEIDLQSLLQEVVEEQLAQGRDVELRSNAAGALPYRCRPVNLKRAVSNLVDNAVRYGKRARVAVSAVNGDAVHIHVEDDGPGIAEDKLQEVFKPFVRLDPSRNRDQKTSSVGLGLSIARSSIEAHGGRLELENRTTATGLRAVISLPA